jgi:two-component system sensor histidine kinase/response regulator
MCQDAGSQPGGESELLSLDESVLSSLVEQLGPEIDGLVERFRQRLVETAPRIGAALESGDLAEVAALAHSLKSVAATFGADRVAHLSEALETEARAEGAESSADLARRLGVEGELTIAALSAWLQGRSGA